MQTRRILIVNDDGISSDGLRRLVLAAMKFGDVWVVAPDSQRSAASHSLTINDPIDVWPYDLGIEGVHAYACSGLPTDCFRIGCKYVMPEEPDVVFSGINNGFNAGMDIQYSATVGAALDAAMCGYPVVAFSEGFTGDTREQVSGHQVTDNYLPKVLAELLSDNAREGLSLQAGRVLNVNFPDCSIADCKGIKLGCKVATTPFVDHYKVAEDLSNGGKRYTIHWVNRDHAEPGTDLHAILEGYVAIGVVNNIS